MKYFKTFEMINAIIDDVYKTYDEMKKPGMRDATVQALVVEIGYDISAVEQKVAEYLSENPEKRNELDSLDDQDIFKTENFKNWLQEDLEIKYDDLMRMFFYLREPRGVEIWRQMKVNEKWFDRLKRDAEVTLGIYWSYDEKAAEPHNGYNLKNGFSVAIHAYVDFEKVNWYKTMMANLQVNTGHEKEIYLEKGTPVNVVDVEVWNYETDVKKMEFTASSFKA